MYCLQKLVKSKWRSLTPDLTKILGWYVGHKNLPDQKIFWDISKYIFRIPNTWQQRKLTLAGKIAFLSPPTARGKGCTGFCAFGVIIMPNAHIAILTRVS